MAASLLGWAISLFCLFSGALYARNATRSTADMDKRKHWLRIAIAVCFVALGGGFSLILAGILPPTNPDAALVFRVSLLVLLVSVGSYAIVEL